MMIAERVAHLGTETAFAVSAEAAAFAAEGNKVYPFHLGDMNIKTPANIIEAAIRAMKDGKTGYCPNGQVQHGERVHPTGRQASHRQVYSCAHESGR